MHIDVGKKEKPIGKVGKEDGGMHRPMTFPRRTLSIYEEKAWQRWQSKIRPFWEPTLSISLCCCVKEWKRRFMLNEIEVNGRREASKKGRRGRRDWPL
jgi:hypothetical protein